MAPNVSDGHLCGPIALFQTWMRLSSYFDDIHVDLKSMKITAEHTLLATTYTSITISSKTLRLVFPQMNSDGHGGMKGGTWSPLAQRLEGQRLIVKGSVRFDWDNVNKRVVRLLSYSDMATAMLRVVGSLEDVSYVFDGALVTPDFRLIRHSVYGV
ncbi:hypothetical protein PHMEG_0004454 [Phytophthora megakarya]|uniref:Uncharacterized protein n=1 Tax=Phytophthora megakarya TaxID=4795 RepID=A0A225WVG1_9STRA|nr:hypothetical protein PHMEG_0004454 [Phytophthora megakarya]